MLHCALFRQVAALLIAAQLTGCLASGAVVIDATPGQQKSRAHHGIMLRHEALEYFVTFRHDQMTRQHTALVSTRVDPELEQEPHWIEFVVDGQVMRLTRWAKLQQGTGAVHEGFVCTGVLIPRCTREKIEEQHYTWFYELPPDAAQRFIRVQEASVALAVDDVAITLDLEDEASWMRSFFDATASGSAYQPQ